MQFMVQYPGNTLGSIIIFHSVSLGFLRNCSYHWTMHGLCNRLVKMGTDWASLCGNLEFGGADVRFAGWQGAAERPPVGGPSCD